MVRKIVINNISKSYGEQQVLKAFSGEFDNERVTCIMGHSGIGKTTLIRLILKLEKADSGEITDKGIRYSAVFQENRLVEQLSAVTNVMMVLDKKQDIRSIKEDMKKILPEDCLDKKVSELSGGMKRRISVIRAMLAKSDAVILDEPFTGLDVKTKQSVREYITKHMNGRIIIIVTHDEEDVSYFNAVKCLLTTA